MKIDDKLVMTYSEKMDEAIIRGLVDPLNQHLVKLVGFEFPAELRRHFRKEAGSWLNKIQRLRMKPTSRTGPFRFYFNHLFDYPFGGNEVQAIQARNRDGLAAWLTKTRSSSAPSAARISRS